jgi:DNA primase
MRANQQPKYLNTSDGELYHKGSQLFGLDLARASAAKAGRAILAEGYTDVLALHQAGMRNAVGIMGTALTEEQVRELERTVGVLELCLDADRAGQDAMLRAARLAAGRKLELRVVPMPEGADPAELVASEGADALRARVEESVPFVVFQVERILNRADTRSAEGRDKAAAELAPVLALPASALREDLRRRVASRLQLSEGRLAALIAQGESSHGPIQRRTEGSLAPIDPAVRTERGLLVLCLALPDAGEHVLRELDPDEHLTSEQLRRAARHLAGRTKTPMTALPPDDDELSWTVADLVARAGRAGEVRVEQLEQQRLLLELARLDRAIRRARGEGGSEVQSLARQREKVREAIRALDERLQTPV